MDNSKLNTNDLAKQLDFSHELVKVSINDVELYNIHELIITRTINQHVILKCSGVIPGADDHQRAPVKGFDATAAIVVEVFKIKQMGALNGTSEHQSGNGDGQILFQGRIRQFETLFKNDVYTFELEGVSYTDALDLARDSQSFQNTGLSYRAVVQQTLQPFPEARFMDRGGEAAIGALVVRYYETAWSFLARLASWSNTGLVADATTAQPRFWWGVPCQNEWTVEREYYTIHNDCEFAEVVAENGLVNETSCNGLYYEVTGLTQLFQLGDQVNFNGRTLYVAQAVSRMTDSKLWHDYHLTTQAGLKQPRLANQPIGGVSLSGKVIAVADDTLKVHLDIDASQDEATAWKFPCATLYSAEGHLGWYCMPEIGDLVKVFFPVSVESAGYVNCSVRPKGEASANDKINDPDIRYLRTPQRRELRFDQTGVAIRTEKDAGSSTGAALTIRFDQDQGIIINSDQDIMLDAQTDLTFNSEQIALTAVKGVTLTCRESKLVFEPQLVHVEGTEINRAEGKTE
jgi:hypothetical protein